MSAVSTPAFQPGFRISVIDAAVLVAGAAGTAWCSRIDVTLAIAAAFVVAHFFLFCNVVRMDRTLELVWSGLFVALACAAQGLAVIAWPWVFAASLACTGVLVALQLRRPSYHGIGWQRINPGLPQWWERHRQPVLG